MELLHEQPTIRLNSLFSFKVSPAMVCINTRSSSVENGLIFENPTYKVSKVGIDQNKTMLFIQISIKLETCPKADDKRRIAGRDIDKPVLTRSERKSDGLQS